MRAHFTVLQTGVMGVEGKRKPSIETFLERRRIGGLYFNKKLEHTIRTSRMHISRMLSAGLNPILAGVPKKLRSEKPVNLAVNVHLPSPTFAMAMLEIAGLLSNTSNSRQRRLDLVKIACGVFD